MFRRPPRQILQVSDEQLVRRRSHTLSRRRRRRRSLARKIADAIRASFSRAPARRRHRFRIGRWIRRGFILLLVAGAVAGLGYVGVHYGLFAQVDRWVEEAKRDTEQGDLVAARRKLERAYSFRGRDHSVKETWALFLLEHGQGEDDTRKAIDLLAQLQFQEPTRRDLKLALAKGQLRVRPSEALRTIQGLLAENPNDVACLALKAEALDRQGTVGQEPPAPASDVVAAYNDCFSRDKRQPAVALRLAELMRERARELATSENTDLRRIQLRADWILDELVLNSPQSAEARVARYRYRRKFGLVPHAASADLDEDLRQAVRIDPRDLATRLAAAEDLAGRRLFGLGIEANAPPGWNAEQARRMEEHLQVAQELAPKDWRQWIGRAMLETWSGHPDTGKQQILEALSWTDPDQPALWDCLIAVQTQSGDYAAAQQSLERFKSITSSRLVESKASVSVLLALREADILIAEENRDRDPVRALSLLESARLEEDADPELRARLLEALGREQAALAQYDRAVETLGQAMGHGPRAASASIARADCLRELGRYPEAIAAITRAQSLLNSASSQEIVTRLWIDRARCELAMQYQKPRDQRSFTSFDAAARVVRENSKGTPVPLLLDIERLLAQGAPDATPKALQLLNSAPAALAREPFFQSVVPALRERLLAEGEDGAASQRWAFATPGELAGLGSIFERQPGRPAVLFSPTSTIGTLEEALRELDRAVDRRNPAVADIMRRAKSLGAGAPPFEGTLEVHAILLGGLADSKGALEHQKEVCAKVVAARPGWGKAHLAAAMVEEGLGDAALAEKSYRLALQSGQVDVEANRRLLALYLRQKKAREGLALIESLPLEMQVDEEILPLACMGLTSSGKAAGAVAVAQGAVAHRPADSRARIALAFALAVRGGGPDWITARSEIERAVALAPADPRSWIAAMVFYLRDPGPDQGPFLVRATQGAAQLLPVCFSDENPLEEGLIAALVCELHGDWRSAELLYSNAKNTLPEQFHTRWSLLPRFCATSSLTDVAPVARQKLDGVEPVLGLLTARQLENPSGPLREQPRLRAIAWLARGGPAAHAQASRLLRPGNASPTNRGDKLLVARLALLRGEVAEAMGLYAQVADQQAPTAFLTETIRIALVHGRVPLARQTLETLRRRGPTDWEVAPFEIRVLAAEKKPAEALALARREIDKAASSSRHGERIEAIAKSLLAGGLVDAANDLVGAATQVGKLGPSFEAVWLSHQPKKVMKSLALCRALPPGQNPVQQARAIAGALQVGNLSPEERLGAEELLLRAVESLARSRAELAPIASAWRDPERRARARLGLFEAIIESPIRSPQWLPSLVPSLADSPSSKEQLLEAIQAAIWAMGPTPALRHERGRALLDGNQVPEAIAALEGVLFDPGAPSTTRLLLAEAYLRAGSPKEASAVLSQLPPERYSTWSAADFDRLRRLERAIGQNKSTPP